MSVLSHLKSLSHLRFPLLFQTWPPLIFPSTHLPITSYHLKIFPFSHHPIFSNNFFLRFRIFPSSHSLIFSLTLLSILSSPLLPIISNAWSATYYVDATNVNNNGLFPSTVWKTIAKFNDPRFDPGNEPLPGLKPRVSGLLT